MFQGDECSRGMSVLGDGCLGGWKFLLPFYSTSFTVHNTALKDLLY